MKQLTTTITIGLFLLLPVACTQEYGEEQVSNNEITVSFTATAGALATQATATSADKSLETGANVTVHAWTSALTSETSEKPALSNTYTVDNAEATAVLKATGGLMQVQTGLNYSFYALSTNSATDAVPALNGSHQTSTLRNGVDYLMATANISNSSADATVSLPFRHLATRIVLTVKPAAEGGYLSAAAPSVSIADTDPTGSYIDLSVGSGSPALITGGVPGDLPNGQTKKAVAVSSLSPSTEFTVSFILLPVTASTRGIPLKLDFTDLSFESGKTIGSKSYTASILPETNGTLTLQGGYSYTYEVTIARYAASFSLPTIIPWEQFGVDMDKIELDPK